MSSSAVALPSFDAFLRSARHTPAVLPHAAPMAFLHSSSPTTTTTTPRDDDSNYIYQTPPGSPYGHFVSLSPTSSLCGDGSFMSYCSSDEEPALLNNPTYYVPIKCASQCVQVPTRMREPTQKPYRPKKKYLKERQRCEIVRRVRAGEKQAHLAKEFGVSRAAVCYLLKHQMEILSRWAIRNDKNLR
ncbi:hypothetical protein PINS_up001040 [Pythium insidiosum]|nr:hypothetical protein PINS_up001040 [Pythium insidiosum]